MSTSTKWSIAGALIVLGGLLFFMGGKDALILMKVPIDVMNADPSELKAGDHVKLNLSLVWDEIISVTETQTTYGVTTSSREASRYYALPYLYTEEWGGEEIPVAMAEQFILLKMSSNYFETMDTAMEQTNDWYSDWWDALSYAYDVSELPDFPPSVLSFEGYLKKLNTEETDYALEYLEWLEYETDKEHPTLNDYIVPYYIQPVMKTRAIYISTLIGAAILAAGIIFLIFAIRASKEDKELAAAMSRQRAAYYRTPAQNGQAISFNNGIFPEKTEPLTYGARSSMGSSEPAQQTNYNASAAIYSTMQQQQVVLPTGQAMTPSAPIAAAPTVAPIPQTTTPTPAPTATPATPPVQNTAPTPNNNPLFGGSIPAPAPVTPAPPTSAPIPATAPPTDLTQNYNPLYGGGAPLTPAPAPTPTTPPQGMGLSSNYPTENQNPLFGGGNTTNP